jgi:hypothetical protein
MINKLHSILYTLYNPYLAVLFYEKVVINTDANGNENGYLSLNDIEAMGMDNLEFDDYSDFNDFYFADDDDDDVNDVDNYYFDDLDEDDDNEHESQILSTFLSCLDHSEKDSTKNANNQHQQTPLNVAINKENDEIDEDDSEEETNRLPQITKADYFPKTFNNNKPGSDSFSRIKHVRSRFDGLVSVYAQPSSRVKVDYVESVERSMVKEVEASLRDLRPHFPRIDEFVDELKALIVNHER